MDIDDILASVSGPSIPAETLDLQALTRAWVAERTAPELLPYPTELIERVTIRLRKQVRLSYQTSVGWKVEYTVDLGSKKEQWIDERKSETITERFADEPQ